MKLLSKKDLFGLEKYSEIRNEFRAKVMKHKELRSLLKDVMYDEIGALQERLDTLNPKERVELLIKLMPYALPKVTSVSHTTNEPLDWD